MYLIKNQYVISYTTGEMLVIINIHVIKDAGHFFILISYTINITYMRVIKRDGSLQEYDFRKVAKVTAKAFKAVGEEVPQKFLEQLEETLATLVSKRDTMDVEEIQDIIQKELIKRNKYRVVEEFVIYRNKRAEIREQKSNLIKDVRKKLDGKNIENQNANVDEASFGGRIGEASRIVCKNDALKYRMSKKARKAHENNEIYIHDLDSYSAGMHNCLSVPLDKLLAKGFQTRQTDVRPAGSVNTAMQLVAVLFQIQSLQQFGGVAATHLDWTMVPYVRLSFHKHFKDGLKWLVDEPVDICMSKAEVKELSIEDDFYNRYPKAKEYAMEQTRKETFQAVEGMYHNLNTLQSRSGNQLPFSSINYGTCTEPEGRMVIEALLQTSIAGLGEYGRTSIFPCGIFQYSKEINGLPGTPNYDLYKLALKSTAQRLYPNYVNIEWSGNKGYDKNDPRTYMSTMGCRTVNGFDINGMGYQKDGRGNICPVTIIMPTLAMQAKEMDGDIIGNFMKILDEKIHDAKDMLIERFNHICSQPAAAAKFMWENGTMEGYLEHEGPISALKHGTLVIGQLGLAETLQILIGEDHTSKTGMELAHRIESLFRERCDSFKREHKLNFGVYYTPAENLCFTAMKAFRRKYGEIPNVSDRLYFTNSIHVPVWKEMDPFTKIDIESQLTGYSNAGCITYVELPSSVMNNLPALETIVNYAMNSDIPYFAVNVPNDTCEDCHYQGELSDTCPKCGSDNITRLRRVCGYLTGDYKTAFNEGKQQETEMRVKHMK